MTVDELTEILPPFARSLNMQIFDNDGPSPVILLPYSQKVEGRPGFIHGSMISTILETAAMVAVHKALKENDNDAPMNRLNTTISFMRSGLQEHLYATATIKRLGRTLANVEARAWHAANPEKSVAMAQIHYLLK